MSEDSFLFTVSERESIYRAASEFDTRPVSFVTRLFYPLWRFISVYFISELVAPNAITLLGVMASLQAYQLVHSYGVGAVEGNSQRIRKELLSSLSSFGLRSHTAAAGSTLNTSAMYNISNSSSSDAVGYSAAAYLSFWEVERQVQTAMVIAVLLFAVAIVCGSVDGVHAKRCRSATSLGDIFSRICSSVSRLLMALTMLEVLEINSVATCWYVVLSLQLIELNTVLGRINANNLKKEKVKNMAYSLTYLFRDSELSFLMLLLLVARWCWPQVAIKAFIYLSQTEKVRKWYISLLVITFVNIAILKMKKKHKMAVALAVALRVVPVFYLLPLNDYNILSVFSDGLVVGLLSIEMYISHLAHRRVHALVLAVVIGSLFNDVFAVTGVLLYVLGVLVDLSTSLNVPLFVPVRNVYIDGVFDLCHAGHKRMMANALKYGNRLIVGVCGDEECAAYKRRPIMTTDERCNEVELCKYVSEVVRNAPVSGITEEMIRYYNVHVVVCGEEYDTPDDTYYAVPRRLGMLKSVPRTNGISTSVLIKRVHDSTEEALTAKDKASGKSKVKEGE